MTEQMMPPVPTAASYMLRRLNVVQERRLLSERTAKDYAIESGGYLAKAAEDFMGEQNRAAEAGEMPNSEYWSALQGAIYEFRKRAEKAHHG